MSVKLSESEPSSTKATEEVVKGCSIENFESLSKLKENGDGILVIIEQQGCGSCSPFVEAAKQVVGGKVKILERGVEDESCLALARNMKISRTPTAIYYQGGHEIGKLNMEGKKMEEIREELAALVTRKGLGVVAEDVKILPSSIPALIPTESKIKDQTPAERFVPAGSGGCKVDLDVEDNSWKMQLKPGPECENVIAELQKLGPASRGLLARHLVSDDPELSTLIRELRRK